MSTANWAGNQVYGATSVVAPRTVDEVRDVVARSARARALGTRHSFSALGDTTGTLVSTRHLTSVGGLDARGRVAVGAGITYGALAEALAGEARALPNFASLPHISVGGAVATASHGSGSGNQSLASAVCAVELVTADGSLHTFQQGEAEFDGAVVSLGALGVMTSVTIETVPALSLRQYVFENVPWREAENRLPEIFACGYSTSLFLSWAGDVVEQAWIKCEEPLDAFFGARPAVAALHPIAGADPRHCTDQLGAPGPSYERLPHFRREGVPSAGSELQSEYAVAAEDAPAVLRALRAIGRQIAPTLHVSEIRAVAADRFWLSPFFERDSVTFHFTWRPTAEALAAIELVEETIEPWTPRPHWAKLSSLPLAAVAARYPRLHEFRALRSRLDPLSRFGNDVIDALSDEAI